MSDFWLVDQIRARVFVVELPGMTRQSERRLVKSCRRLVTRPGRLAFRFPWPGARSVSTSIG